MKFIFLTLIIIVASVFTSCDLDGFLFNSQEIDEYTLPGNTIPDTLIEQVAFDSEGNTLYGYWVASDGTRPGLTILYCHGNKYNIDEYWDRVMMLSELGMNILIFDYRGYGMSEGDPSEDGLFADGTAALEYVLSRPETVEDSLIIYGYSLGNVASIYLAAEKADPLCLIAECPFASANSLTQSSSFFDIPPLWLTEGEYDNAGTVKGIETPFLLFHGEEDDFVRWQDNGKIVYENALEPKMLYLIGSAEHNNIPQTMGIDNYLLAVEAWILLSIVL